MSPCLSCQAMSVWSSVICVDLAVADLVDAAVADLRGDRVLADDERALMVVPMPDLVAIELGHGEDMYVAAWIAPFDAGDTPSARARR